MVTLTTSLDPSFRDIQDYRVLTFIPFLGGSDGPVSIWDHKVNLGGWAGTPSSLGSLRQLRLIVMGRGGG